MKRPKYIPSKSGDGIEVRIEEEYSLSLNNRLICEVYKKEALRTDESKSKGFSMIAQKTQLKGLKVLVDAIIGTGPFSREIPAGTIAYIKEEMLHTSPWAAKVWSCDSIDQPFIIVDVIHVEFVK